MEYDKIIECSFPRDERLYLSGYFNSGIEQNMLSSELHRKGMRENDTNPGLCYAVKLFQKGFITILDSTFSVDEQLFYTSRFSISDMSIEDNKR